MRSEEQQQPRWHMKIPERRTRALRLVGRDPEHELTSEGAAVVTKHCGFDVDVVPRDQRIYHQVDEVHAPVHRRPVQLAGGRDVDDGVGVKRHLTPEPLAGTESCAARSGPTAFNASAVAVMHHFG